MTHAGTVCLMYHELELPGRGLCQNQKDYVRYVISEADFRAQLCRLQAGGFRGMSVSEALDCPGEQHPVVGITFDDGCETDLLVAAPLLKDTGFNATFYIVAGFLGRRGYLSPAQLQELSDLHFEIGCHSMTHSYLSSLGPDRLRTEVLDAKQRLEQLIGRHVDHLSCPGGRWSYRVAQVAQEVGYRSVSTSRIGANSRMTDRFRLSRVPVLRATSLADFDRLCRAEGLFMLKSRSALFAAAKSIFGDTMYEKARSVVLGRG